MHVVRKLYRRVMGGTLTEEAEQEGKMLGGDTSPDPCPKCGNPSMLFTPNAQRVPYAVPRRYEAAWQCTNCGYLLFPAPRPEAKSGRDDAH